MTTIITRKGLEKWTGRKAAPDVAYIVSDHNGCRAVTWGEVHEARRLRQRTILARMREVKPWRAVRLWVAYFDQSLLGGWHAFLDDLRSQLWIERDGPDFRTKLMEMYPLLLPFGGVQQQWEAWKTEFAKRFQRRRQCKQPVGVTYLWCCGSQLKK